MSYLTDLYKGTITEDADGVHKGKGITAALLKPFVDEQSIESSSQKGAVKRAIVAAGEDPSEYNLGPGATVYDAQGAVTRTVRDRTKDTKNTDRINALTDQLTLLTKTQAPQIEEMRANNARLLQQGNQQFQLSLMQMADQADARAAELEYQKLRDRKADMQYNERMEALDRKDRRTAMQGIVAGLASLGAAFAM